MKNSLSRQAEGLVVNETDGRIQVPPALSYPGGNPGANLKSISHICHPSLVAFVWELTEETINVPLGCLQGGV